ncbi:membrane protein insertion efficiency factor YidD [Nostoc sp. PCC 9305]|uniref:membrane protein insertion efficiency factor YidD n=1 Tax=Nostoc sp. PCC 9305 TaxID=296636 RepID=UPI0039C5D806
MRDVTRFIDNSHYATKRRGKSILRFKPTKTGFRFIKKGSPFRLLSLLDSSLRSVAIGIIGVYQRHLSPRKGYSCAHRIVYGGDSCSEYVKNALADKSLFESTLLARQRFRECNIAYISSKTRVVGFKVPVIGPTFDCDPQMVGACCALLGIFKICSERRS